MNKFFKHWQAVEQMEKGSALVIAIIALAVASGSSYFVMQNMSDSQKEAKLALSAPSTDLGSVSGLTAVTALTDFRNESRRQAIEPDYYPYLYVTDYFASTGSMRLRLRRDWAGGNANLNMPVLEDATNYRYPVKGEANPRGPFQFQLRTPMSFGSDINNTADSSMTGVTPNAFVKNAQKITVNFRALNVNETQGQKVDQVSEMQVDHELEVPPPPQCIAQLTSTNFHIFYTGDSESGPRAISRGQLIYPMLTATIYGFGIYNGITSGGVPWTSGGTRQNGNVWALKEYINDNRGSVTLGSVSFSSAPYLVNQGESQRGDRYYRRMRQNIPQFTISGPGGSTTCKIVQFTGGQNIRSLIANRLVNCGPLGCTSSYFRDLSNLEFDRYVEPSCTVTPSVYEKSSSRGSYVTNIPIRGTYTQRFTIWDPVRGRQSFGGGSISYPFTSPLDAYHQTTPYDLVAHAIGNENRIEYCSGTVSGLRNRGDCYNTSTFRGNLGRTAFYGGKWYPYHSCQAASDWGENAARGPGYMVAQYTNQWFVTNNPNPGDGEWRRVLVGYEDQSYSQYNIRLEWASSSNWTCYPQRTGSGVSCRGGGESARELRLRGCFAPDTEITMHDGSRLRIDEIQKGQFVRNPVTGKATKIKKVVVGPENKDLIEFGVAGAETVIVTQAHPVPTQRGMLRADQLSLDDQVQGADGTFSPVILLETHTPPENYPVFNIELEGETVEERLIEANGYLVSGDLRTQLNLPETK